ncbi:MAG: hypothetical protein LBD47_05065 [Treponema sp.]|jgi:hypothetical protein|nr:hypothetical protein [Treponema sp.]
MRYAVTAAQKVVLSLLISLVLFTAVTVLAFTGLPGLDKMLFAFPTPMNMLLLLSIFFTIFLTVFFCFNLRQDPVTIILYRLQSLRKSLMEQFYEQKGEMDWARWTMELEQRREGVHAEIKRGIKWGGGRYSEADIDSFIDTSWDELLELIGAWGKTGAGIDEEKLRNILTRVLQTLPPASSTGVPAETSYSPETVKVDETAEEFTKIGNIVSLGIGGIEETEESPRDAGKTRRLSPTEHARSSKRPLSKRADEGGPETRPKAGGLLAAAAQKRAGANSAAGGKASPVKAPDVEDPIEIAEELEELEEIKGMKEMKEETEKLKELAQAEELEELAEVEETEDDDELGELEELKERPRTKSPAPKSPRPMADGIKGLESAIEFSDNVSGAKEAEKPVFAEVEIVSPFSSMFSSPETETILQENGVPRINSGVLSPDKKTEAGLDKDFKNLVDTVVKR